MLRMSSTRKNTNRLAVAAGLLRLLAIGVIAVLAASSRVSAQSITDYSAQIGAPPSTTAQPVELGFVNLGNGNLHLEIPLGTFPQRGGSAPLTFKLTYDSRIWLAGDNGTPPLIWAPRNFNFAQGPGTWFGSVPNGSTSNWGGWRLATNVSGWLDTFTQMFQETCRYTVNPPDTTAPVSLNTFAWVSADGSIHYFPESTIPDAPCPQYYIETIPKNPGFSNHTLDSTGFLLNVSNYTQGIVYGPDGSQLFPAITDTNGNAYSKDTNGNLKDTLGRVPILTTNNCNGLATQVCYDVLNSQGEGHRSRYTVTTASIPVSTSFGQSNVVECSTNCTLTVISQITLPDGTNYTFFYDSGTSPGNYGELKSVQLPTGGTLNYGYETFEDLNLNRNRWLHTYSPSNGGSWTFTPQLTTPCSVSGTNCQQQLTKTSPEGDDTVYSFVVGTGAWKTSELDYSGSSTGGGTLLGQESTSYTFNSPVPLEVDSQWDFWGNFANEYLNSILTTTTIPFSSGSSLVKQTQTNFDLQHPEFGVVKSVLEWSYHSNSGQLPQTPDRATYFNYVYNSPSSGGTYSAYNILNKPISIAVCSGTGNDPACGGSSTPLSKTLLSYDTTAPSGVHGNLSTIQNWVSASTTLLTTTLTYDSFGNLITAADPANHQAQFGYQDNFYLDATPTASTPTPYTPTTAANAYPKTVMLPLIGTTTYGYYYTGKPAFSTDPNGASSYAHFLDPFDRATHFFSAPVTSLSGSNPGWSLNLYPTAAPTTQFDTYSAIATSGASTSCASCRHDQLVLDAIGRPVSGLLQNDPDGADHVDTVYDSAGRVLSTTNPYRSTSDATYGFDTNTYDGLGRLTKVIHSADNSAAKAYYGPSVFGAGGGLGAQLCAPSMCGLGYPSLAIDEAGKAQQRWTDGFGRLIEVDDPGAGGTAATNASSGTGVITITGAEQVRNTGSPWTGSLTLTGALQSKGTNPVIYDSGTLSVTVNGFTETVAFGNAPLSSSIGTLACALEYLFADDPASPVTTSDGTLYCMSGNIQLNSKSNSTVTVFNVTTSVTYDSTDFTHSSFSFSPSSLQLTGGTTSLVYDTGNINVTVNGVALSPAVNYGQTSTPSSLATSLASAINGSSGLSAIVSASASGNTVNLTAKTGGTPTNYSISATAATTSTGSNAFPASSFEATTSWTDLTGGTNSAAAGAVAGTATVSVNGAVETVAVGGTTQTKTFTISGAEQSTTGSSPIYDSGYVTLIVNPCRGTTCALENGSSGLPNFQAFTATAQFQQGSTANSIAQNLACVLNAASSPVTATVSGASITLTPKSVSATQPAYTYQLIPNSFFNYQSFSKPSFVVLNPTSLSAGQYFDVIISESSYSAGGTAYIEINNSLNSYNYYSTTLLSTIATQLAQSINQQSTGLTATVVNTSTVRLTVQTAGTYSVSAFTILTSIGIPDTYVTETISPNVFDNLIATNGTVTTDTGTAAITVNGVPQASVSYSSTSNNNAPSLAAALVTAINGNSGNLVTAWADGATITLTSKTAGASTNYTLATSVTSSNPSAFNPPSFQMSASGATLTGGASGSTQTLTASSSTSTFYQYDALGNLLSATQGGQTRSYTYDGLSRVTSYCVPENGASNAACGTTNVYYTTASGGLCAGDPSLPCRIVDPQNVTITFNYDALSRLTSKSYNDGKTPTITYCYDSLNTVCLSGFTSANGIGRRTAMKDGTGTTGWSYDPAGNVILKQRSTNGVTQAFNYTHYLDGSVESITYPSGRRITYAYNNAQRPVSAVDSVNGINYATGAHYAAFGGLSSVAYGTSASLPQGISQAVTYNHRMQLAGIYAAAPGGTILDFTYNQAQPTGNNGSIASVTNNIDPTRSQSFTYDGLNRIASAQSQATSGSNCWGYNFGLDSIANLTSVTLSKCSGFQPAWIINSAKNQLTSFSNKTVTYDLDGRLTYDGTNTYAYDAEDRLTSAGGVTYSYDGNGLRVMKSNGTIYWRGAGGSTLVESNLTGGLQNEYIFFGGGRIARRDSGGNVFYSFTDHLGNTRAVTNASGTVCYQADFTPYGGELTPAGFSNSCTPNYRFTGYEYDSETQNNYAIARYYNPGIARFLSVDPIDGVAGNSQSWNKYAYVGNNPANLTDSAGMDDGDSGFVFAFGSYLPPESLSNFFFQDWNDFTDWAGAFWEDVSGSFISLGNFGNQLLEDPTRTATNLGLNLANDLFNFARLSSIHTSMKEREQIVDEYIPPAQFDKFYRGIVSGDFRTYGHVGAFGFKLGASALVGEAFLGEELSSESIISTVAREQYSKGATQLLQEGFLSEREYQVYMGNPRTNSRFLGTGVHRATDASLARSYPGRFNYNLVGPDFYDNWTGESIELTTPGQVSAHVAKGGAYATAKYATYF